MPGYTDARENEALNEGFRKTGETYVVSLHTADPGEGGSTVNEVSGGPAPGYTRQAVAFSDPANGQPISNIDNVDFPDMPAVTVTHVGIHRASDNLMVAFAALAQAVTVASAGNILRFEPGQLRVSME